MKLTVILNKFIQDGQPIIIMSENDYNYYIKDLPKEPIDETINHILNDLKP